MMIAEITPTSRRAGRGHDWERWPAFYVRARDKRDLEDKLSAYGVKRYPIYQDTQGGIRRVGSIYTAVERDNGQTFYRQNWVKVLEVQSARQR